VLELAPLKPCCWFRYVDDTFVIWLHGQEKIKIFLHQLNSIHQSIQFSMEAKSERHIPFLDKDIYKRADGSLGHKVGKKLSLQPEIGQMFMCQFLTSLM
jgi:hypothetical protein